MTIFERIQNSVKSALAAKGLDAPPLELSTELLGSGSGLDSLDLAGILVDLEYFAGFDPFHDGFKEFRTAGELVNLYTRA
jgi:acyl carrier protein